MLFKNIFLILLIKSGLLLTAASAQQESTNNSSDLVLFLQSRAHFLHFVKIPTADLPSPSTGYLTNVMLKPDIHINSIDYHPRTKTFYFTNPRVGYWSKNAQLSSIPWDPDFICTAATAEVKDLRLEMKDDSEKKEQSDKDDSKEDDDENADKVALMSELDRLVSAATQGKPVCFVDKLDNKSVIFNKKLSELKKLVHEKENWNPRSIAVDYVGDKIYIVDTSDAAVSVYDLDGRNKALVFRNDNCLQ
ncbi:uncharacterized protein LOC116415960 [Nasonia vitripennis]|uniref:Uncharacterized protein n=1 Tax=Nasonia vitripennis TaxID=7425 RepID=A0A7M7T6G8_NASVI|nr:uncharacterized protein LOC116415960 [Nasonia vitripennis]